MKHENNAGLVLASLMAILSSFAVAGVFDDAHFLFYGGVDRNGNGAIDKNDIYDYRHYTNFTSKTATFQIYSQNNFTAAEKQQAFSIGNETVRLATAGITLENEPCIRWHQYDYTEDDVGMTKYSFLQSESGLIPNAESYTFIMRFRPISLGKAGASCAFLNFGNKWGTEGMYLYTQVNDSSTGGCIKYANGSPVNANVSSLVLTNGVWHEVVMVLDGPNRKITIGLNQELGFDWRGPSYGHGYMLWYTRTIPESTTGWSFTPTTYTWMRLFGDGENHEGVSRASANAFRADIHMVGLWPRALSQKEIYEALGNRRPAVFEIGDQDSSASTFFKGAAGQDVTIDALPREWHSFPAVLANGATATIRFTVP